MPADMTRLDPSPLRSPSWAWHSCCWPGSSSTRRANSTHVGGPRGQPAAPDVAAPAGVHAMNSGRMMLTSNLKEVAGMRAGVGKLGRLAAGGVAALLLVTGCSTSKRLASTSDSPTPTPPSAGASPVVVSPSSVTSSVRLSAPPTVASRPPVSSAPPSSGSSIGHTYDGDPAVQAFYHFRDVEIQAFKALNMRYPALLPLETNKYQGQVDKLIQNLIDHKWHSVGFDERYVVGVTKVSALLEKLDVCYSNTTSYVVDAKGNVVANSYSKHDGAAIATMVFEDGRWKIDQFVNANFSCAGLPQ